MSITIEQVRTTLNVYQRKTIAYSPSGEMKKASVLVPLVMQNNELHVLLTARTNDVETHKGQISFPGGVSDPEDTDSAATALREAEEEIGLPRDSVELLGVIDDVITPSKFLITPVVGFIQALPPLTINAAEVAEVLIVPLSYFADATNGRIEERVRDGKTYRVWFFDYGNHLIWGATAGMLKHFLEILTIEL